MTIITTHLIVSAEGAISAATALPAGEHQASIEVGDSSAQASPPKSFTMDDFRIHDMGWDDSVSLRREDIYSNDDR